MQVVQFLVFIAAFCISLFFAWYIPGRVVLGKLTKAKLLPLVVLSLIVGMVLWGWQGYILGYLGIRTFTYLYVLLFLFLYIKKAFYKELLPKKLSLAKIDPLFALILCIGTIGQNIFYIKTGFFSSEGMMHMSFNPPDHYWHTSLISEMARRFPPFEPGMYGIQVTNYHYWFNLITAELVRVFQLPLFHTQYQGMYVAGSLLLGLMAYVLAMRIYSSKLFAYLLLFFLYFGSDATYHLTFITRHVFDFTIPEIIDVGYLFMDNPPRAYSVIVALCAIYLLFFYLETKRKEVLVITTILFGSLVGFKVYTGITFAAGFSLLACYLLWKKDVWPFIATFAIAFLSAIVFLPVNANSGGMMFLPFERPRDFITYKPLGVHDLEMRWRVFLAHNNYLRLTQYGFIMAAVYIFAQFGLRIIGFIPYKKAYKILGVEKLLFFFGVIASALFIGIFFSQKAHVADSFNFFLPAILILSILTSLTIAVFCKGKSKIVMLVVIILVIGLTLPRFIYRMQLEYARQANFGFVGIPNAEIASYAYLKNNTPRNSIVLVANKSTFDSVSAIVSIFSERNMYLSGQGVLIAHEALNKSRVATVDQIMTEKNPAAVKKLLKSSEIDYLYFYGKPKLGTSLNEIGAEEVFSNGVASVYRISD